MKTPRDMTQAQFEKALAALGFKLRGFWMWSEWTGGLYGCTLDPRGRKIIRRASLARAIQLRSRNGATS